jgi:hypothetical protein
MHLHSVEIELAPEPDDVLSRHLSLRFNLWHLLATSGTRGGCGETHRIIGDLQRWGLLGHIQSLRRMLPQWMKPRGNRAFVRVGWRYDGTLPYEEGVKSARLRSA